MDDPKLEIKPHAVRSSHQTLHNGAPLAVDVSDTPSYRDNYSSARNIFGVEADSAKPAPYGASDEGDAERLEAILTDLREKLRARGAVGIRGLARNFKICDTSKDNQLQPEELVKCLQLCRIKLSDADFKMLFEHVDASGDGKVDYDEFLKAVRGRMPPLRRKLVGQVFRRIDHLARKGGRGQGDGILDADDLMHAFSGKNHPEVRAGKKTESAVLGEMLQQFEGSKGNRDGRITMEEWISYYEELSASVENDDYFDQMIMGAWAPLFDPGRNPDSALMPPIPTTKIDEIEKLLIDAIRARSSNSNEAQALEKVFKQFDANKNGTIDLPEFCTAMERFGMATSNAPGAAVTPQLMSALFDRYDTDGMGSLSYEEFIKGVFKVKKVPPRFASKPRSPIKEDNTTLELPPDPVYQQGSSHVRGRGGVMGGGMNAGMTPSPRTGAAAAGFGATGGQQAAGMRSAVSTPAPLHATQPPGASAAAGMRSQVTGRSFTQSSGIFR